MAKKPPVPPANRSPKGTGSDPAGSPDAVQNEQLGKNLREQGDSGNIKQNTTHQGYQQDR